MLGVTGGAGKPTAEEHAAFKTRHLDWMADATDEGLVALRRFLEGWSPENLAPPTWHDDLRDQNLVFRLSSGFTFLHDRPAAKELWRKIGAEGISDPQIVLSRAMRHPWRGCTRRSRASGGRNPRVPA